MTERRYETVAIARHGLNFKHTEGTDYLAKVTYHWHVPGEVYDPRVNVVSEWLIPIPGNWDC